MLVLISLNFEEAFKQQDVNDPMSKTSLLKRKNVEIELDRETGILYCHWIGLQDKKVIMESGQEILDLFKDLECTKILNDNTKVIGPWHEATEWVTTVWFPSMIHAGLKHFAWVLSTNIFAELSAKQVSLGKNVIQYFNNYEQAVKFLKEQK